MTRVAVVIPYYQRQPGLLRRALESICAQKVEGEPDLEVEVLVVNDQSPVAPGPETEGLARDAFRIRIVERPNGGPAEARNTGLDAAAGADYVAFLDSDDWWEKGHLALALAALRDGAQLYFADHSIEGALAFDYAAFMPAVIARSAPCAGGRAMQVSGEAMLSRFVEEQAAHLSCLVLDARALGDLRFDERRKMTGEDYLYLLAAIARCERVAFSLASTAARGRGIDFYRSAYGWDNPDTIKRLTSDLTAFVTVRRVYCRSPEERRRADRKINARRREILFLLLRNARSQAATSREIAAGLIRHDPGFWLMLPHNLAALVAQKLRGRLEFVAGQAGG